MAVIKYHDNCINIVINIYIYIYIYKYMPIIFQDCHKFTSIVMWKRSCLNRISVVIGGHWLVDKPGRNIKVILM